MKKSIQSLYVFSLVSLLSFADDNKGAKIVETPQTVNNNTNLDNEKYKFQIETSYSASEQEFAVKSKFRFSVFILTQRPFLKFYHTYSNSFKFKLKKQYIFSVSPNLYLL